MSSLSSEVLGAFGLKGKPKSIAGGRGLCYVVDNVVLRPSEDEIEDQWVSELVTGLLELSPMLYRLPTPVAVTARPSTFSFKGWAASSFLSGAAPTRGHFIDRIQTSRVFHADLEQVIREKPEAIDKRVNRWAKADRVTWEEARLDEIDGLNETLFAEMKLLLDKLAHVWRPLPADLPSQLIHGDLTGNMLFSGDVDVPPAIIDFTFYWRPAEYANAIIVADGLAWAGEGTDLVEFYATDGVRLQLLIRALFWRYLTFAVDSDLEWVQENLPKANYARAVGIVCNFAAALDASRGSDAVSAGTIPDVG